MGCSDGAGAETLLTFLGAVTGGSVTTRHGEALRQQHPQRG